MTVKQDREGVMPKMKSSARQLRLELALKRGKQVSIREVAEEIGVDRRVVMKIENNDMERVDMDTLARLADFYHRAGLDARHIMEFDPTGIMTPGFGATPVGA
jgi:transcriptional regulator with XRE-family HTH domain